MTARGSVEQPAVAVLADDLIWATRLADALTAVGARPIPIRRQSDLETLLSSGEADRVVVDLTARAYDGVAAIAAIAAAAGGGQARIVAVGQHDDAALRRRALAAGAERVFTYRQLFEAGPSKLGAWLAAD